MVALPGCGAEAMVARIVRYILRHRQTWLAPLLISLTLFAALFLLVGGHIRIPSLYR